MFMARILLRGSSAEDGAFLCCCLLDSEFLQRRRKNWYPPKKSKKNLTALLTWEQIHLRTDSPERRRESNSAIYHHLPVVCNENWIFPGGEMMVEGVQFNFLPPCGAGVELFLLFDLQSQMVRRWKMTKTRFLLRPSNVNNNTEVFWGFGKKLGLAVRKMEITEENNGFW